MSRVCGSMVKAGSECCAHSSGGESVVYVEGVKAAGAAVYVGASLADEAASACPTDEEAEYEEATAV